MFPSPNSPERSRRSPAARPHSGPAGAVRRRWEWSALLGAIVSASAAAHVLAGDSGRVAADRPFGSGPVGLPASPGTEGSWRPAMPGETADRVSEPSPDPAGSMAAASESMDARLPRSAALRITRTPLRNTVSSASQPSVPELEGTTRRFMGIAAERRDAPRRIANPAGGIRAPPASAGRA
jgi:hypothetical protein